MTQEAMNDPNQYPPGLNQAQVREILDYYENQSPDALAAADEAAWQDPTQTIMSIPNHLVPAVRKLLAQHAAPGE